MFLQDFTTIDRSYADVVAYLAAGPGRVLGAAVDWTRVEGERLKVRVCPAGWPVALAKAVDVQLGPIRAHEDTTLIGFTWQAAGGASLFPRLDADLEVAPFGTDRTNLTLRATYHPPAGILGRRVDDLLLHRLAESTIRAFLDSVAANLRAGVEPADALGAGDHH